MWATVFKKVKFRKYPLHHWPKEVIQNNAQPRIHQVQVSSCSGLGISHFSLNPYQPNLKPHTTIYVLMFTHKTNDYMKPISPWLA